MVDCGLCGHKARARKRRACVCGASYHRSCLADKGSRACPACAKPLPVREAVYFRSLQVPYADDLTDAQRDALMKEPIGRVVSVGEKGGRMEIHMFSLW